MPARTASLAIRKRLPWMVLNLGAVFTLAAVVGLFRATIEEFILLAEENYAAGLAATDPAEAASYFRRIRVFWPEYKDVDARLTELESGAEPQEEPAEDPISRATRSRRRPDS